MTERVCQRCGTALYGKQRRWCGENCRRRYQDEHQYRAACEDCGEPLSPGSARASRRFCVVCWQCREAARVNEWARRVERWWAKGLSVREIERRMGWAKGRSGVELFRLRELGYDLPYRYRGVKNGRRFPDQVAA